MKMLLFLTTILFAMTVNAQQDNSIDGIWECDLFTLYFTNSVGQSSEFPPESIATQDRPSSYSSSKTFEFVVKTGDKLPESWKKKPSEKCKQIFMIQKQFSNGKDVKPNERSHIFPPKFMYEIVSLTNTKMILRNRKPTRGPRPEFNYYTLIKQQL